MNRKITITGIGLGDASLLTGQALEAVRGCDCLIGARRVLDMLEDPAIGITQNPARYHAIMPGEIRAYLDENPRFRRVCVAVSGDVGFYSAAKKLLEAFPKEETELVSGVGSLAYFTSRMKIPWDDVYCVSAHGRDSDVVGTVKRHKKTFILTGNTRNASELCGELCAAGLGEVRVTVGENLSYPHERILTGTAQELGEQEFGDLSVMLVERSEEYVDSFAGHALCILPDEEFFRGDVPMTKYEIRCVAVSNLQLRDDHVVYDIGAGTGSVAVEAARRSISGAVYAVEKNPAAVVLLRKNRDKFGLENLYVVQGEAPESLRVLPKPHRAFIGGTTGKMEPIFALLLEKNPHVRIVVSAITLETLSEALRCFKKYGMDPEIVQIAAARSKTVAGLHMMMGQNPVYLLTGQA